MDGSFIASDKTKQSITSFSDLCSTVFEDMLLCILYKHNLSQSNLHKWILQLYEERKQVTFSERETEECPAPV